VNAAVAASGAQPTWTAVSRAEQESLRGLSLCEATDLENCGCLGPS